MNQKHGIIRGMGPALAALVGLLLAASGCEHSTPTQESWDPQLLSSAADLSASSQTAAGVGENLEMAELFVDPMGEALADLGLTGDETAADHWSGEGVDYPEFVTMNRDALREIKGQRSRTAGLSDFKDRVLANLASTGGDQGRADWAPGDTLAVEYFDGPDSTGLNAVIGVEPPSRVRFVSLRSYPDQPGPTVVRRDSEIELDTKDTWEDGSDDDYYRIHHEEERTHHLMQIQLSIGDIQAESGDGPFNAPGVRARAVYRVENPHLFSGQEWRESVVIAELGEMSDPGDDLLFSMRHTVHWLIGSEYTATIREESDGPITDDATVGATALFTPAPANPWLETISDVLRARLGDLEDPADDLLLFISRDLVHDGEASDGGSPRSHMEFTPEEPLSPGEEPCGGDFLQESYYPESWWLWYRLRELDMNCDGSGSLHLRREFRDGSVFERWVTWDGEGNATLTEAGPNGTAINGTWSASTGEYEVTTQFPDGHDPIHREQSGQRTPGHISGSDILFWQDGSEDVTVFTGSETPNGFHIEGSRERGDTVETFILDGSPAFLEGDWTRSGPDTAASGHFTLEALEGGGRHLVFDASDPEAPGDPVIEGEAWFAPDGSGYGTVTLTQDGVTATYHLQWEHDGQGELADGHGHGMLMGGPGHHGQGHH